MEEWRNRGSEKGELNVDAGSILFLFHKKPVLESYKI
jgi:hypothetical protein